MNLVEAIKEVRRKARFATMAQFKTYVTDEDFADVTKVHSRLEEVADEHGVRTRTTVYDTTAAAIELLEMIAPVAPASKSLGGVSVSYEAIAMTIQRLKASQFVVVDAGRFPRQSGAVVVQEPRGDDT